MGAMTQGVSCYRRTGDRGVYCAFTVMLWTLSTEASFHSKFLPKEKLLTLHGFTKRKRTRSLSELHVGD